MLKSHERFYSINGKRQVLVASDHAESREFFRDLLQDRYILIIAEEAEEAVKAIRQNGDTLSLAIFHLGNSAEEAIGLLNLIKTNPDLQDVPVMNVGDDREAEIESLSSGAIDFVLRPFPPGEVILARVMRTIELSEDREIIISTERDPLTGLYNRDYFYRYAEQFDHHNKDLPMDALVLDVNNFNTINERFGISYGDAVLRRVGERVRDMVRDTGGIVCRRDSDIFMVYCPHGKNYQAILDNASIGLAGEEAENSRVRLRMGVYANVDKSLSVQQRFDRAVKAADSVRSNFNKSIGMYDSRLHKEELRNAQMVEEFPKAIEEKQFVVYYQPKFDVRGSTPVLASAEALIRWQHPVRGLISPGEFIPLFEENGLVQELDHYTWKEAIRQIREWKDRLGYSIPISVNVSRIDMYDPGMIDFLMASLKKGGLQQKDLLLEITESAYTKNSEQIIDVVNKLRDLGFRIEMDDFGSGYSSLNMISTLPVDVLKLDMGFIRMVFEQNNGTRMLEIILDIADHLDVPVVAEGVETEQQMKTLRDMGCQLVQGYYFSRPLPAEDFEKFIVERMNVSGITGSVFDKRTDPSIQRMKELRMKHIAEDRHMHHVTFSSIARALSQDYFGIFYVDVETDRYIEYRSIDEHDHVNTEKEGKDFFKTRRKNIIDFIHPDDRETFLEMFTKENILNELRKNQIFTYTYRLIFEGIPSYVYMKVIGMEEENASHIVIGLSNVDIQIRREEQLENELGATNRDELTGVKSRSAYIAEEKRINEAIAGEESVPFAIALCDMNGYNKVSRCQGQGAADGLLKKACAIVCDVFEHSPVYRVGDDEFIAILRGRDYERRKALLEKITEISANNIMCNEISLAVGVAEFIPEEDQRVVNVFERADEEMLKCREYLYGLLQRRSGGAGGKGNAGREE